jgi:hypothetical protein
MSYGYPPNESSDASQKRLQRRTKHRSNLSSYERPHVNFMNRRNVRQMKRGSEMATARHSSRAILAPRSRLSSRIEKLFKLVGREP